MSMEWDGFGIESVMYWRKGVDRLTALREVDGSTTRQAVRIFGQRGWLERLDLEN